MKTPIAFIAITALLATTAAYATETGSGCGLGAQVMKGENSRGANIAAAILNNLVIPNTFFMTTGDGLMGCDPTKAVQREEAKQIFVASNIDKLSTDAAKGQGDHLIALGYLLGVDDRDMPSFQRLTQSHYDEVFGVSEPTDVLAALDKALEADASLAKYVTR
ncbi:MAG: DUF3015 family protein [Thiotrichales bacterium]